MTAYLNPRVMDNGLSAITSEATRVYLCSAQPTTYAEATSTYALGNKSTITVGSPADASPSGRKVTVSAITGGSVTGTGTASHYAVVDSSNSRLLAANTLSASQAVTSGNTFSLGSIDITIPNPAT